MDAFQLGWFVGIFEGEGSIYLVLKRVVRISVPQKDPELLYRLKDLLGGSISFRKNGVPYWYISGRKANQLAAELRPHVTARRRAQIDKTLEAYANRPQRRGTKSSPGQLRLVG